MKGKVLGRYFTTINTLEIWFLSHKIWHLDFLCLQRSFSLCSGLS